MSEKTNKRARFVINMNTGAHGPRTSETDALPLTFKLIDDETCKALATGRVSPMQVVEAIKKSIMSAPDFSWDEFDRQRQAEKVRLNVSQHDMVPVGESAQGEEQPSAPEDVVKLSDILNGKKSADKPADSGDNFIPVPEEKSATKNGKAK